ncbi:MAG: methylmalonyl Co-A mutase-associated GTPase MeaB, partial [Gemmatimonadetes bacterium]|nr:methylmalonyl Co-A mutase-associated GTPase MeaB [Gemmatimonadota bacterium]
MSALLRGPAGRTDPGTSKGASGRERLVEDFRAGKRPALARAISMVEGGRPGVAALLRRLLLARPQASRLGVTGPPGAGKSSLIAGLANLMREGGEEVAIVAVDPTSPFSGGALLGDRIRMNDLATDPGIFIRSMATRGSLGGLAATTREVIDLLDAFGFPNILVETVGVGQTELEIASTADSVAVVLVPESGDGIQAMKAGLMEIADLFVVNKSDRIGADRMVRAIRQALLLRTGHGGHDVPAHHGVDLSSAAAQTGPAADPDPSPPHPPTPS